MRMELMFEWPLCGPFQSLPLRRGCSYSDSSNLFRLRIPLMTWRSSTSANLDFNRHERNQTIATTPTMLRTHTQIGMSISTPQIGGKTSISTSPVGIPIQPSLAPSATISSSRPGVKGSGRLTCPDNNVTIQEPQFQLVQLVGISTLAAYACSTKDLPGISLVWPNNFAPRRKRMRPIGTPQRSSQRDHRPVCLLK